MESIFPKGARKEEEETLSKAPQNNGENGHRKCKLRTMQARPSPRKATTLQSADFSDLFCKIGFWTCTRNQARSHPLCCRAAQVPVSPWGCNSNKAQIKNFFYCFVEIARRALRKHKDACCVRSACCNIDSCSYHDRCFYRMVLCLPLFLCFRSWTASTTWQKISRTRSIWQSV